MAGLDPAIHRDTTTMPAGFVYIPARKRNGTLYIGVTYDLPERMQQHRAGHGSKFVHKYGVTKLVYFEEYPLYADAIRRETNLKRWKRSWKTDLIEKHNPRWSDLLENWNR
jgi:putative endonuclease